MSNSQTFDNPYTSADPTNHPATTDRPAVQRVNSSSEYRKGKKTGKSLIDSPIFSVSDGVEIGKVHDVIYNSSRGRLVGVTVESGAGFFGGGKTLLLRSENMKAIGEDAITVETTDALSEIDKKVSDYADEAGEAVLGKRMLTDDGSFLGKVDDVLIDRESRRIVAYEVSGGMWNDLMRGQTDVPVEHVLAIGPDVVVVPASVKAQVQEVTGGLIGSVQVAAEKAGDVKDAAAEKIGEARTAAAEKIEDSEIKYAVGRIAGSTVTDDKGGVIVSEGDTITEENVQAALAADKVHALTLSAGKSHASDIGDELKQKAASAQEAFKDKQADMLVGKTAGRDVTDDNGIVIVNGGSTVTEADVSKARECGKLGDLTAAVANDAVHSAKDSLAESYDSAKSAYKEGKSDSHDSEKALPASGGALPPSSSSTVIHTDQVIVESATIPVVPPNRTGS